jgi:hypothetical protein
MSFSHVMLENFDIDQEEFLRTIGYKDDIALLGEGDPFSTAFSLAHLSLAGRSTLPINPIYYPIQTEYNTSLKNKITNFNGINEVIISDAWFTNGQYQPYSTISVNEWEVLVIYFLLLLIFFCTYAFLAGLYGNI